MSKSLPVDPAITIRAEISVADPDTCKFTASRSVYPGGPFFFESKERANGSPLIESLFSLPGIVHALVNEHVVTVGKASSASWSGLKSGIGTIIRNQLLGGAPAIFSAPGDENPRARTDGELRVVIQDLLDKEVNRSIAAHGGKISVTDVRDAHLFIAMSGGCQGCAASQLTLRQGFEVMVRKVAPEIVDIVDMTDHAMGTKPYYERTA
jgi:Fe-S cluster biogenesis protein NfuA